MGSHEVAGIIYVNIEKSQMASIGAIFTYTYHTKQLNPWQNSSAKIICGEIQPDGYLSWGDGEM